MRTVEEHDAIRHELGRVLSSAAFVQNERQSRFLRFLVDKHLEGKGGELKESVIAVEVFGRDAGYDPKVDAIVRTEAVRLRARLDKYYASEGRANPLVIELPKGGYKPVFRSGTAIPAPPAGGRLQMRTRQVAWLAVTLVLLGVVATAAWWSSRSTRVEVSIAVRPFENLTKNPETDYFADGLTDEIIRNLSVLEGLRVPSRTSTFALKDKALSAPEAGKQLGADYLVEGSVLQTGQRLRVNVALVRVRDDTRLWSDKLDREVTDVFAIHDEISRGIVNSLRLRLQPGRRRYETNLEAYDLYLRGRQAMAAFPVRGRQIVLTAVGYYDQAIAKDPSYALAYAGLADTLLAWDRNMLAPGAYSRAKAAAEKAVELDPLLSEAQSAMATVLVREYAWDDAERRFRRAIELNPNNALARLHLGASVLLPQGRVDEALKEVRLAAALDPLSPYMNSEYGRMLVLAGRYGEAVDQLRKAIELDRTRHQPNNFMGRALYLQGKTTDALAAFEGAIRQGAPPDAFEWRACALERAGLRDQAVALYAARDPTRVFVHFQAVVHLCLGETARGFELLERSVAEQEARVVEVLIAPELAPLRADARFAALRRKVNLPQ